MKRNEIVEGRIENGIWVSKPGNVPAPGGDPEGVPKGVKPAAAPQSGISGQAARDLMKSNDPKIYNKLTGTQSKGKPVNVVSDPEGVKEAGQADLGRIRQLAGMQGGDFDDLFKSIGNMPNANVSRSNNSTGTINGKSASYDDAMAKFKDMSKGMGLGDNGSIEDMMRGLQGKMGQLQQPQVAQKPQGQPQAPQQAQDNEFEDPTEVLSNMSDEQIQSMDGEQAKQLLAKIKSWMQ